MTDNITLRRAVVEQVREALESYRGQVNIYGDSPAADVCTILDAALAEPEPEPEPALVEQLFALAKLTVRRAADPDPWSWDRLADDGSWTPFQPLIHGPDMWRLEQALRAALGSEMSAAGDDCRQPATVEQVISAHGPLWGPSATADFFTGWRAAERHHGITKEDK